MFDWRLGRRGARAPVSRSIDPARLGDRKPCLYVYYATHAPICQRG